MATFDPAKYQKFKQTVSTKQKTGVETAVDTAKEKGVGLLKGTLNVLNTFAYGVGGALSGVSPSEGIKRKILPSQALGITNAVGAFAADVLLDPTTYVTLGAGGGAKIATKAGAEVVLNKLGTTALRETIQKVGSQEGKKQFAELIAKNPQWLDKSGLKFMGQTVIPQTAIEASFKAITKPVVGIAKKIPGVEKLATATKSFAQGVFDPLAKTRKLPMGEQYFKKFGLLLKSTRSEIVDATELTAKKYAEGVAKFGKTFGDDVTEYIEKGVTKNPEIAKIGQDIVKLQDEMATEEELRKLLKSTLGQTIGKTSSKIKPIVEKYSDDILSGVIKTSDEFKKLLSKSEKALLKGKNTPTKLFERIITTKPNVDNYLRHYITDAGREYIKKGGDFYGALPKPLRAKLQSANTRTIRASISDINKAMQGKVGGDFFESNAFKALAGRQAESIKAINIFDFIDGVKKDYGVQAIKGEKERFIDGVKYIPSTNPQLEGMLLPEPIAQHIDDTVKFINGDEATNNFLKGYDKVLRFWKGSVTGWFPAFHTRNMIGGSFNNWLGKVSSKSYAISEDILDLSKDLTKTYKSKIGETFTGKQLLEGARKHGAIGQPGMIDVMKEVEKDIGKSKLAKLGDYPVKTMEFVENRIRFPMFVDRVINRGWSMEDAAKDVFKYHFDYAPEGLSSFERNWLKRLFPFYTWCVPTDTEILTKDGWKFYDEIKIGDIVLTYNVNKDVNEWQPIKDLAIFDFDDDLMVVENRGFKFRFTKDHRFPVIKNGKRKILKANEINSSYKIPLARDTICNNDSILSERESSLLGWIVTDGYFRWKGNSFESMIYQHPKKFASKIRKLFGDWISSEYVHPDTGVICFRIKVSATRNIVKYFKSKKDLPSIVTKLSKGAVESMYEAMMDAEGSRNILKGLQFTQKIGGVLDAFQIICNILGKSFNIKHHKTNGCCYGYVKNNKDIKWYSLKKYYEHYNGLVWCPVTDNSTWVMRQNGKVIITGNTRNNIPLQIEQMIKQPGKYAAIGKLQDAIGGEKGREEFGDLPDWMKQQLNFRIGGDNGMSMWMQLPLPAEDLAKLPTSETGIRDIVSMLSPVIKTPIELVTNKNLFFGSDIVNPELKDYPELQTTKTMTMLKNLPDPIKKFLNVNVVQKKVYEGGKPVWKEQVEMDAKKLYILKSAFGRFYSTIEQVGGDKEGVAAKLSRLIGGIPTREVDIEQQKYWDTYNREAGLKAKKTYEKSRLPVEEE